MSQIPAVVRVVHAAARAGDVLLWGGYRVNGIGQFDGACVRAVWREVLEVEPAPAAYQGISLMSAPHVGDWLLPQLAKGALLDREGQWALGALGAVSPSALEDDLAGVLMRLVGQDSELQGRAVEVLAYFGLPFSVAAGWDLEPDLGVCSGGSGCRHGFVAVAVAEALRRLRGVTGAAELALQDWGASLEALREIAGRDIEELCRGLLVLDLSFTEALIPELVVLPLPARVYGLVSAVVYRIGVEARRRLLVPVLRRSLQSALDDWEVYQQAYDLSSGLAGFRVELLECAGASSDPEVSEWFLELRSGGSGH